WCSREIIGADLRPVDEYPCGTDKVGIDPKIQFVHIGIGLLHPELENSCFHAGQISTKTYLGMELGIYIPNRRHFRQGNFIVEKRRDEIAACHLKTIFTIALSIR